MSLQAELEASKRKEDELKARKFELEEQHKMLQRQRTKELQMHNDKLLQREQQLKVVEQELEQKRYYEKSRPLPEEARKTTPTAAKSGNASILRAGAGRLKQGTKCRYESGNYGWLNAVVQN